MIGISPIGISGFGRILVYGYKRVPFPPAIITTGTSFKIPCGFFFFATFSSRNKMSDTTPFVVTTGSAVMECCTINACAFACSFLEILLGSVFIRPDTGAFSSPVRISQRRISPSVTTPSSFCCSLVTNKIPLALRSMRCIASTTVLSGDIKNNANCSVFIWEPPCFFFRFLQENVLFFYLP